LTLGVQDCLGHRLLTPNHKTCRQVRTIHIVASLPLTVNLGATSLLQQIETLLN
jgi:hypothetical protein